MQGIIIDWIRGKDGYVNNSTYYDLLSIVLQNNSSIINDSIREKGRLKYKCKQ